VRLVGGSVVGFDDLPEAAYFAPPLTTVRQELNEVGRSGAQLLLDQIADGSIDELHLVVDPPLVVRRSTATCS